MADAQQNNGLPDWLAKALGYGGGLGSVAGGAYNLFGGGGKNPADQASATIGQIPGQTKPYYDSYMQAGKGALGDLQNQYGQLLGDTGGVYDRLGAGYKESPGYQFRLNQALQAGGNAAAAGGMAGSPQHQQQSMQMANDIAGEDYEKYINHVLGLYGAGLGGEEGINKMGYDANKDYAGNIANALSQQAAYQYSGQDYKNKAKSSGIGDIFSGLGMLGGTMLSGGNPAGGAAGSWLGKKIGGWFS